MRYIKSTLLPDEKIMFYTRPHRVIFSSFFLWIIVGFAILGYSHDATLTLFGYLMLLAAVYTGISAYFTYISSEYGITDKRVLMKIGFIRRNSLEIFFQKIESIHVEQTILGRVLDYGSVTITGTGGSNDTFNYIPDPLGFRRRVQEQVEQSKI
jgi:uncharacterized membrane protein YdbT with pleckstrin-like domain